MVGSTDIFESRFLLIALLHFAKNFIAMCQLFKFQSYLLDICLLVMSGPSLWVQNCRNI